ncbi:septum formation initiator family protein [bacterium]|nr:septum formation initiator family protein [bacterium]
MENTEHLKFLRGNPLKRNEVKKRVKKFLLILLCIVVAYMILMGDNGLIAVTRYRNLRKSLEEELENAAAEGESLQKELERLENDTTYIERLAREKYGLAKDNEKIYRFREKNEGEAGQKD